MKKDRPRGRGAQRPAACLSDPPKRGWFSLGPPPTRSGPYSLAGGEVQVRQEVGRSPEALFVGFRSTPSSLPAPPQECTKSLSLVQGTAGCGGDKARQSHLLTGSVCTGGTHSHHPPHNHNSSGPTEARTECLAHCWVPSTSIQ